MATIELSPLTRIEGHLSIETKAEPFAAPDGRSVHRVTEARCAGEMFRGFETILRGRDPLDAQQFVQRICGVCPIPHGLASCRAQEMAYGIQPTRDGRLIQNLIAAANFMESHILHFYHLSALDFVDVTAVLKYSGRDRQLLAVKAWVESQLAAHEKGQLTFPVAPFLPRFEGDYVQDAEINCSLLGHYLEALTIRRIGDEMTAVFGAKIPHSTSLVPGGCTQVPTLERILAYKTRLDKIREFIEDVYMPDVVTAAKAFPSYWDIGASYGSYMAYGAFETDEGGSKLFPGGTVIDGKWAPVEVSKIAEDNRHSWFSSGSGLHPEVGETQAAPGKAGAYSWLKAARYGGRPMEVGPLARVMVGYHASASGDFRREVDGLLQSLGVPLEKMNSVLGRHLSRLIEARQIVAQAYKWLEELTVEGAPAADFSLPESGKGYGLIEAARGALGHWISIENYKIKNYQCIVPTTWNCSPRDDGDQPGPVEKALEGVLVARPDQPIEIGRVVRSFDPCLACAVH